MRCTCSKCWMRWCSPPNLVSLSHSVDHMTPEQARQCFPITRERAYLFSGGLAPAATSVREAHDRWTQAWMYDPAAPYANYKVEWELARERFAALIGADPDEVAIVD